MDQTDKTRFFFALLGGVLGLAWALDVFACDGRYSAAAWPEVSRGAVRAEVFLLEEYRSLAFQIGLMAASARSGSPDAPRRAPV